MNLLLEDIALTKRRLSVLEKTQDALIVFILEKLPTKEVLKLERFFINTFDDGDLPDEALSILNVIRAYATATYHAEAKKAIRDCFNAIPDFSSGGARP